MDLSKVFDTINHDLLLTKLKTYGLSKEALSLMCSYLKTEDKGFKSTMNLALERSNDWGSTRLHRLPAPF